MQFPSHKTNYSAVEVAEGKPLRDDLTAVADQHGLGGRCGGWSAEQVALYLTASLHALHQISPERWSNHHPRSGG